MDPKDDECRAALAHLLMIGDVEERKTAWVRKYHKLMLYHRGFMKNHEATEKGKAFLRGEK